jgi:hypothetical protein
LIEEDGFGTLTDPRLQNVDEELAQVVFDEFKSNVELVTIHLRDARNILDGIREDTKDRALAKAVVLLAAASLESNLIYLSGTALRLADKRPKSLAPGQIRYLKAIEEFVDENGRVRERPMRQTLSDRLQIVPKLLARTFHGKYELKTRSAAFSKLKRTIERRDAIVHPRADRYVNALGRWEAAESIDAVELYLNSISSALHPYLVGYFPFLFTIPGWDHHEVAVGHRTMGKRGPKRPLSTMDEAGILKAATAEWFDSHFLTSMALSHGTEKDSDGSMLTRSALILLYAMLDSQLSVVAQWRMREDIERFQEAEVLFLNEWASGIGHDGELWLHEDHQNFKSRIKAVPAILGRAVEKKEASVDLSKQWGSDLLVGKSLRDKVMHPSYGQALVRVSKAQLIQSAKGVYAYFDALTRTWPETFKHLAVMLRSQPNL